MTTALIIYLAGILPSWAIIAGLGNGESHYDSLPGGRFEILYCRGGEQERVRRKEDLGFAISWGLLGSSIWPITLPISFFGIFGFGAKGWSLRLYPKGRQP